MLYDRTKSHLTLLPSETSVNNRVTSRVWLVGAGVLYMLADHVGLTSEAFYQWNRNTVSNEPAADFSQNSKTYGLQWGIAGFIF